MNVFLQPLSELEELQNALKQLKSSPGIVQISGCMDAQKAPYGICGERWF